MQNGNMGKSDQQDTREGENFDLQIPQPCGETCPNQSSSTSNSDLYDASVSRSQRNTPKNKIHPNGIPMARSGKKEKMVPYGLGEGLKTKMQRRPGVTRPTSNQRSLRGETLVEMGQRKINIVGNPLEGQVCPRHQRTQSNSFYEHKRRLNHLESILVQQNLDPKTHLLGSEEWKNNQILGGHMETRTQMENPDREELQQEMIAQGKIKIHHYYKQENDRDRWSILDKLNPQNRDRITKITKVVEEEMGKMKIVVSEEEDQLRWDRKNGGEFNLKEACNYIMDQDQEDSAQQWGKIWGNPQWPKIKMFKWIVLHNRILTWENLRSRVFIGPSRCHLCQAKEETTNHLLDECNYTTKIWDWATGIFR
jgi:hypothetical protein